MAFDPGSEILILQVMPEKPILQAITGYEEELLRRQEVSLDRARHLADIDAVLSWLETLVAERSSEGRTHA